MQIKLNPSVGDCWNTYAHVLFKKGDIEGAQKAVKMALEIVKGILFRTQRTRSVFDTNQSSFARRAVLRNPYLEDE